MDLETDESNAENFLINRKPSSEVHLSHDLDSVILHNQELDKSIPMSSLCSTTESSELNIIQSTEDPSKLILPLQSTFQSQSISNLESPCSSQQSLSSSPRRSSRQKRVPKSQLLLAEEALVKEKLRMNYVSHLEVNHINSTSELQF